MFSIPDYNSLISAIIKDPQLLAAIKEIANNGGKYLGTFNSLEEVKNSYLFPLLNDYVYIFANDMRTLYIYNGKEWLEGYKIPFDYLDPLDFCLVLPSGQGTINEAGYKKLQNNFKALKIYVENGKTFYHADYEDNNKYYFLSAKLDENNLLITFNTLEIVKATAAYSITTKRINVKYLSDAANENANNIAATRQIVVGNFSGTSGNLDEYQIEKLLNYNGSGEGEGEQQKKLINPLFVKLWDNSSGLVYQLVLKPINNSFGSWYFTNVRVLGSTLNASIEVQRIVINITNESTASWTKIVKNIQ